MKVEEPIGTLRPLEPPESCALQIRRFPLSKSGSELASNEGLCERDLKSEADMLLVLASMIDEPKHGGIVRGNVFCGWLYRFPTMGSRP